MSTTYLLDANALIALAVAEHEHHDWAAAWAAKGHQLALCPIVEGALIRFLVRVGADKATGVAILSAMYASSRCDFWEDSISYTSAALGQVVGRRQVTDAYLVALAASRGGRLITFDQALAKAFPGSVEAIG